MGGGAAVSARQASAFILGVVAVAIALISPVAAYRDGLNMWIPGGMLLLIPLIGLPEALLRDADRGAAKAEGHPRPHRLPG